jgi:hypothetical protein
VVDSDCPDNRWIVSANDDDEVDDDESDSVAVLEGPACGLSAVALLLLLLLVVVVDVVANPRPPTKRWDDKLDGYPP